MPLMVSRSSACRLSARLSLNQVMAVAAVGDVVPAADGLDDLADHGVSYFAIKNPVSLWCQQGAWHPVLVM